MPSSADQLFALFEDLHLALLGRDALRAEALMVEAVEAISSAPAAARDERLISLLRECDRLATAFHADLARAMQGTAQSHRAARSYSQTESADP